MVALPTNKVQEIIFDALSLTNDGVAIFDASDTLIYCNDSMAKLFEKTAEQILNKTFNELIMQCFNSIGGLNIEADDIEAWLSSANLKRRSVPFRNFEIDSQDGRWYLVTEQLVNDNFLFMHCTDITEKKQTEIQLKTLTKELHKHASIDALTMISNRRSFYEMAEIEFVNSQRYQQPLTLMLIDIDNFKAINDNFGHAAGDTVLKEFAQNIKSMLRSGDLFGRLGGDEFSILLPNTAAKESLALAERIRNTIAAIRINYQGQYLRLTASIGIDQSTAKVRSIHDMINTTDKALYQAKSEGRNKVCSGCINPNLTSNTSAITPLP